MSDRDRLAADLLSAIPDPKEPPDQFLTQLADPMAPWKAMADRLIALGWTRLPEPGYCRYPDGSWHLIEQRGDEVHVDGVAYFRLDEERLARALHAVACGTDHALGLHDDFAAAIAKAYREDADG